MAETDKEFVSRMEDYFDAYCGIPEVVCTRLLTLARRGAAAGELLEALKARSCTDPRCKSGCWREAADRDDACDTRAALTAQEKTDDKA